MQTLSGINDSHGRATTRIQSILHYFSPTSDLEIIAAKDDSQNNSTSFIAYSHISALAQHSLAIIRLFSQKSLLFLAGLCQKLVLLLHKTKPQSCATETSAPSSQYQNVTEATPGTSRTIRTLYLIYLLTRRNVQLHMPEDVGQDSRIVQVEAIDLTDLTRLPIERMLCRIHLSSNESTAPVSNSQLRTTELAAAKQSKTSAMAVPTTSLCCHGERGSSLCLTCHPHARRSRLPRRIQSDGTTHVPKDAGPAKQDLKVSHRKLQKRVMKKLS